MAEVLGEHGDTWHVHHPSTDAQADTLSEEILGEKSEEPVSIH